MQKIDVKSLAKGELVGRLVELGVERYRAAQLFRWLYKMHARSFDEMTDIPLDLRDILKREFHITHAVLLDSRISALDGTAKYLLKLEDANTIEAVFLPERSRNTVCLSSQVGCRFGCVFCASSSLGFARNLKTSEILDEVLFVRKNYPEKRVTNLVFMGIGEPLDNYDNVMRSIRIFNDADGFGIGARKITISTCGIIPGIERLPSEKMQFELSVSLHSADDKIRSRIVPVNKKYPLKELMDACAAYTRETGRVITFEYVLIEGLNASRDDALKLAALLKGLNCKVNAIVYNQIKAMGYQAPSGETVKRFKSALRDKGINVTSRKSRGEDIDAGCGQLRIARI